MNSAYLRGKKTPESECANKPKRYKADRDSKRATRRTHTKKTVTPSVLVTGLVTMRRHLSPSFRTTHSQMLLGCNVFRYNQSLPTLFTNPRAEMK